MLFLNYRKIPASVIADMAADSARDCKVFMDKKPEGVPEEVFMAFCAMELLGQIAKEIDAMNDRLEQISIHI